MVAINQNNNKNISGLDSPNLSLNSNLKRWFSRNIGLWKSERSYFMHKKNKKYNICMNLKIEGLTNKDEWKSHFKFSWSPSGKYEFFDENPEFSESGEMEAYLKDHQLIREKFYLSNKKGISNIKQVDEHEMIFESSYEDWYIIEHTRLIDMDNFRYRVIYSWNRNNLEIVETHHETRIVS